MRVGGIICLLMVIAHVSGVRASELSDAINASRGACRGISDELRDMKTMAGINTGVTAVGTVAGGVALGTGIAKAGVDKRAAELDRAIAALDAAGAKRIESESEFIEIYSKILMQSGDAENVELAMALESRRARLNAKSKSLGNWRTGMLATSTATNIAGAAIAGTNRIDGDLQSKIDSCISSVERLNRALGQARVSQSASESEIAHAQKIASECGMWQTVNLSSVNKRARGATVSSGIGAGVGFAGTIVSAVANSDKTRDGDAAHEKNLNAAANIMAGATTVASGTALVFNATQISAIKRAADVADQCEGVL